MVGGTVRVRRVYEEPEPGDGTRVLVDRIWPRGLTKAKAALDEWCSDVAPSDELRKGTATTRTAKRPCSPACSGAEQTDTQRRRPPEGGLVRVAPWEVGSSQLPTHDFPNWRAMTTLRT
jgi:hypothetical protein